MCLSLPDGLAKLYPSSKIPIQAQAKPSCGNSHTNLFQPGSSSEVIQIGSPQTLFNFGRQHPIIQPYILQGNHRPPTHTHTLSLSLPPPPSLSVCPSPYTLIQTHTQTCPYFAALQPAIFDLGTSKLHSPPIISHSSPSLAWTPLTSSSSVATLPSLKVPPPILPSSSHPTSYAPILKFENSHSS